jgi:pilus assembly protein CpaF
MTPAEAQARRKETDAQPSVTTPLFGKKKPQQVQPLKLHPVAPAPSPHSSSAPLTDASRQNAAPKTPEHPVAPANDVKKELDAHTLSPHLIHSLEIVRNTLKQTMEARVLARLTREEAAAEILSAVEHIANHNLLNLSHGELKVLGKLLSDEVLGLGPLEPLLARQDISEIMVNGPDTVYIEVDGLVERSPVVFRDEEQLVQICQRIATSVGRRVDEGTPICDARLADGSRVNVILPPLALDGPALTIRKFRRDKLTLEKLIAYGSVSPLGAELIKVIAACRTNVIVSGGTGSGKTTMLNCLTRYIYPRERIVTCEDSAELQLQQPHVVRLETRISNIEGAGEVTMRDLVRNCLRMRPERIIVGEVRGPEAFDLLQAMNTGHDGSMGTVHANNPREALSRLENMVAMNRLNLSPERIREQIAASINVIIQVQRLRDGSRKVVNISEITGMEGEVVMMQDLLTFQITGEDSEGRLVGHHKPSGLRPRFYDRLREFRLEKKFDDLMEAYFIK